MSGYNKHNHKEIFSAVLQITLYCVLGANY